MAGLTKTEGGVAYPARCFLDRSEQNKPSTWALRVYELIDNKFQITETQLGRAAAALSSKGFMGNQRMAHSVGKSHKQLEKALLFKYRQIGVSDDSIPSYLLPASYVAHSKGQNGRKISSFMNHSGIKGMKWGIRKRTKTSEQTTSAKAKKMSSDQLKTRVKRMQLERQYSDLVAKESKANQTRLSKGKGAATKALKEAGQEQLKNVFFKGIGLGVKVAGAKVVSPAVEQVFTALKIN